MVVGWIPRVDSGDVGREQSVDGPEGVEWGAAMIGSVF